MNPFESEGGSAKSDEGRRSRSRGRSIRMQRIQSRASSSYTDRGGSKVPPSASSHSEKHNERAASVHTLRAMRIGDNKRSEANGDEARPMEASSTFGPAPPYQPPSASPGARDKDESSSPWRHFTVWAAEAGWVLLTSAAFVALVVVLAEYDDKRLPEWPLGLTLNTVVAFLATVCRSITIIPVAEGLSQLKWNWFVTGQRPVRDLHVFDQASRYPWSSLVMLTRMRGRALPLGITAAVVLVSGVVTSFLTQSTIAYSTRLVRTSRDNVTTRYSTSYPPPMVLDGEYIEQDFVKEIERAAFQAVFFPVTQGWPAPEPSCSSANCRWEAFSSLSICVSMANVTDQLVVNVEEEGPDSGIVLNATLLDGRAYLQEAVGGIGTMSSARIMNVTSPSAETDPPVEITPPEPPEQQTSTPPSAEPTTFPYPGTDDDGEPGGGGGGGGGDVGIPEGVSKREANPNFPPRRDTLGFADQEDLMSATFFQLFFIYNNEVIDNSDKDHRFRAAEVLWHFCVNTYDVGVDDGVSRTDVAASHVEVVEVENESNSVVNYFTLASADGRDRFNVTQAWSYEQLEPDLRRAFAGAYSTSYGPGDEYSEFVREFGNNMDKGINTTAMGAGEIDVVVWENLGAITNNIAQSMTAHMRNNDGTISGEALTSETFVTVRWEWLTFLAAQIGLSAVFLIAIMIHTASLGVDVVKSTSVAELFAMRSRRGGYDPVTDENGAELRGINPRIDKKLVCRLMKDGDVWSLDVHRKDREWPLQGG